MDFSLFRAGHKVQRGASRWMLYFMAMLGSASGQETLLDYWFLWSDEKAASPGGDASRVIRVEGAKGEHYVPVYEDMHCHPLVAQARAGLNARRRQESLELSRQYQDAGMSPKAAYEKAWAEVYQRFRSQSSKEEAKEALLQLVARTQATGAGVSATDAAVQHVLQLLVLHEELLATAEARELLDYLFRQQLIFEKEALLAEPGDNDTLMVLFADAMEHGMEGANAFRDAYFKLNRERIMEHQLLGYRAPWGAGMGTGMNYRQASRKKAKPNRTLGSGTLTSTVTGSSTTSKNQQTDTTEEETPTSATALGATTSAEQETNSPKPVDMGPMPSDSSYSPRRLTMLRATAPTTVAASDFTYVWNGTSANSTWLADIAAQNSPWGSQTASGNNPGVYENGYGVKFDDSSSTRDVTISGTVAPGTIIVNTSTASGSSGGNVENWWAGLLGGLGSWILGESYNSQSAVNATLYYGYALTGADVSACIADVSSLISTKIVNSGASMLVLNSANTYTGGTEIQNGALYLGCANAAGQGAITLHRDNTWTRYENKNSGYKTSQVTGAELVINYNSSDPAYKTPTVRNPIIIADCNKDSDAKQVRISFGNAAYGETRLPAGSRYVSLTGGIYGEGDLYLYGYTFANESYNYVSAFFVTKTNSNVTLLPDGGAAAYSGTVYLKNEFNTSEAAGQNWLYRRLLGGAVQLVLEDDVFANATLNMTREQTDKEVGWKSGSGWWGSSTSHREKAAQTSDNILLLSGDVALSGLDAAFLGKAWRHNGNETLYENITQDKERWRVRVVANSKIVLTLNDAAADVPHIFSGAMGFAQSYVQPGQEYINEYDAGTSDASFTAGGGTLSVESLSLTKRGAATQYIHSAKLQDLSLIQGTLGFNNLSLSGNLNLVGGTHLELGVSSAAGWTSISNVTTNSVSVADGNRLLVITPAGGENPFSAVVDGSITLGTDSSMAFYIMRTEPGTASAYSLLNVNGSLNLQSDTPISLTFSSIEFAKSSAGKTYYLAGADSITVGGEDSSSFVSQMVPLGHGYYGILDTEDNENSRDYLVMTVVGDPRRTWSGYLADTPDSPSIWKHEDGAASNDDLRWKEKHGFQNGHLVLFGNRYEPVGWNESDWTASAASTSKVSSTLGQGILETVEVDGEIISNVDKICVSGEVAPAALIINADYFNANDEEQIDNTNYYFYTTDGGKIRDVNTSNPEETALLPGLEGTSIDLSDWKTSLRKLGTGTVVINMANSFSGGTTIEGGRLVMQNAAALGAASGEISILNGAMLQGDFADESQPQFTYGDPYAGEKSGTTTTVLNPVNVVLYQDPDNPGYRAEVDAYIANASDKKMVLTKLSGAADTVVTLYGTSYDPAKYTTNTYAVFKVLDPGEFYGTIKLDGNLLGTNAYQNLWDDDENNPTGGRVQMEIMTTAMSGGDAMAAAGKIPPDWLNTTIDLTVENGTERTVLALDALGSETAPANQKAQVAALQGVSADGSRMNSSVLSMSHEKVITLEIEGSKNGDYDGVLGFGDFQKTVDYDNLYDGEIGMEKHHYGRNGADGGVLNVNKLGLSTQSINSAWLNVLEVGKKADNVAGGRFITDEALVVNNISSADGSHIAVGSGVSDSLYALAVGRGGVLAFDNAGVINGTGEKIDALAYLGAGRPKYEEIVPVEDSTSGETKIVERAPSAFVYLDNGATISAFGDWYTNDERSVVLKDGNKTTTETIPVSVDIANGATVTFNTHNYTPDASISSSNDVFGRYNQSHVIQLLAEMKGSGVNLIFNNELISEAAQEEGVAWVRADGLGYEGTTGTEIGHVSIRDLHQHGIETYKVVENNKEVEKTRDRNFLTGNIIVKDMTALQVTQSNTTATAATADMEVTVTGKNAALQFVDGVTDQYINQVNLEQGGHILLGGELQTQRTGWTALDQTQVEVDIAHREGKPAGSLNNLDLVKNTANKSISIGGTDITPTVAANVHITSRETAEAYNTLELRDTHLLGSIVELHKACQLDIADAVVVDRESVVRASVADGGIDTSAIAVNPEKLQANLDVPDESKLGNKVSTSVGTVVQMTFAGHSHQSYTVGTEEILVVQADQLQGVNVTGDGLTLQIHDDTWYTWVTPGTRYMAVQMGGGSGQFHYEVDNTTASTSFGSLIGSQFVLQDKDGNTHANLYWVTSTEVGEATGKTVSPYLLYFAVNVPEPATATLSLLALAALAARRRRR